MYLKKLDKRFPEDFQVIDRKAGRKRWYLESKGTKEHLDYVKVQIADRKGTERFIPQLIHHPVYRLLQELVQYDLTDKDERMEFLAALSVAVLIDDYGLIHGDKKLYTLITSIDKINGMADLNHFMEQLGTAEKKQRRIIGSMGVEEIHEELSAGQPVAVEIEKAGE